jgi:uncharacterized protein YjbI with pentapeptide repeats
MGADLQGATLVDTDLTAANLTGCRIFGVAAWGLKLDTRTKQQNLIVTIRDDSGFVSIVEDAHRIA